MNRKYKSAFIVVLFIEFGLLAWFLVRGNNIAVLNPKGVVAQQQHDLIITATLLSLIIIVPVFVLTFLITWKYRAGNVKAKYTPEWDHSKKLEFAWWAIPSAIILVLAVMAWQSSHKLDPFRPLDSDTKPITVQVVALQWKWLFIYPEQKIASVNFVQFPEDTPVNFVITADAPMNSFWIPSLGGQIYAMSGMSTKIHLMASETGDYNGSSANISGHGFAGMKFIARASTPNSFLDWVSAVKSSPMSLGMDEYNKLAQPSESNPPAYYSLMDSNLYDKVIMKYMMPASEHSQTMQDHMMGSYQ